MQYLAHKGRTKKLKRHDLHGFGFALDQPSINRIGPINRSEKNETVGNCRQRSETIGNMIRPKLVQPAFLLKTISAQRSFF